MDYGYTEQSKTCGVYNIKGLRNTSQAIIIPAGLIELKLSECVSDKRLESVEILKNVFAEIYLCSIVDSFLMTTKKLPIIYTSIFLEKPGRRIYLFKIYLYFTITAEIKKSDDLIDNKLDGIFSIEIVIDDKHKEINKIDKFPGLKGVIATFTDFIKSDGMIAFTKELVNAENERLMREFKLQYGDCTIPKPTISLANYKLDDDN